MSHTENDDWISAVSPWLASDQSSHVQNLGWAIIEAIIAPRIRRIIHRRIVATADREDCYQEIVLVLWQQLPLRCHDLRIHSIGDWICGLTSHVISNQIRRRKKNIRRNLTHEQWLASKANSFVCKTSEQWLAQDQAAFLIQSIRPVIPPVQLEIFLLRTMHGLSPLEIARQTQHSPAQIHLICHRVKKTIREFFQKKKEFSNFS